MHITKRLCFYIKCGIEYMDSIYDNTYPELEKVMQTLLDSITQIRTDMKMSLGMDPVEHLLGRIKSEESMREKCRRKGLPETSESALSKIHDAIGIRIVCTFVDDIYTIRDRLAALPYIRLIEEKDYIRQVKPNGYRSLHLILEIKETYYARYSYVRSPWIPGPRWNTISNTKRTWAGIQN